MKKPELLIPAKGTDELKIAVKYGADAVYIGGEVFSLRAAAKNFDFDEMKSAVEYAHENGVRVHVTANILAHDYDLSEAEEYFKELKTINPDALIISDPGMYQLAKDICPDIERHISTQANNTNYRTFLFWKEQGAKRVVAARELSLSEIADIKRHTPDGPEIECFIHGAMCISYSGRCLLSNYFTGRDANRGECTHPCRWTYSVAEETRPGEYLPVFENERGTYIFNSKDLCMIEHIPELITAGIDSFKIEGRMKNALYVATVARTYRRAIDDYTESEEKYRENLEWYKAEIRKCTIRDFTTGFYFNKPRHDAQIYDNNSYIKEYTYLGYAEELRDDGTFSLHQKNKFSTGEEIEIMRADYENIPTKVAGIYDEDGNEQSSAPHPGQSLFVKLTDPVKPMDILRRREA
ncbi:MAG: U32 family peptidase [Lachnospiraceae bacterium]|nr:U32 family peptidase [Lachnospiraceae bacterium]